MNGIVKEVFYVRFYEKSKGNEIPVDPVAEKREIRKLAVFNYCI